MGREGRGDGKGREGGMGREGDGKGGGMGREGGWEGRGGKASEMMMESAATGSPIKRKTFGARTRTNNKLDPHLTPGMGIEPGHSGVR